MKNVCPVGKCFEQDILVKEKYEVALNQFDYEYLGGKVEYFHIDINDFYDYIKNYIYTFPQHTASVTINKKKYNIDLSRIYLNHIYCRKEVLLKDYLAKFKLLYNIEDIASAKKTKKSYHKMFISSINRLQQFFELFYFFSRAKEDHATVNNLQTGFALNYNNKLFNKLIKGKVIEIINSQIKSSFFKEHHSILYKDIETLISIIFYLELKKISNIYLSNFTGIGQYACLLYGKVNDHKVDVYQHGNYTVHGIPCPYKLKYLPQNIHLYESEFITKANLNIAIDKEYVFNRLNLEKITESGDYILIATSPPLIFNMDFYYYLWSFIKSELLCFDRKIILKLHPADTMTIKIIEYFEIRDRVQIIEKITILPKFAITCNSSIYHELKKVTKTFNENDFMTLLYLV